MAGAGFKTFNTGDVLTASDVNTYLMQQTTMVFADASARSTALGANVAEGMISYLKDTNAVERYDGSSWGAIGAGDIEGVTAGAGLTGGGTSGTVTLSLNSLSAGRNAIINGGMDIWQRGTSNVALSASEFKFSPDRWAGAQYTTAAGIIGQTTSVPSGFQYGIKIGRNNGATSTGEIHLRQVLETINSVRYQGQTVVLSFWAKAGANFSASSSNLVATIQTGTGTDQALGSMGGWTGQATDATLTQAITTSWVRYSVSGTISASATQIGLDFTYTPVGTAGADDNFYITGVQLELGSTATPFSRNGSSIQGELAACQRYYFRINGNGSYNPIGTAIANATTTALGSMAFMSLRTTPSSVDYTNLSIGDGVNAIANSTGLTLGASSTNNVRLDLTGLTGLTQYRPYILYLNNSSNQYIGFNAEL